MPKFAKTQSLSDFQVFIGQVFGLPDDRLFSISDLVSNQERFTMRALKGIRKGDREKINYNLLISLSWLMALANRLHIPVEDYLWRRFPAKCSYCGQAPCVCKKTKPSKRPKLIRKPSERPKTLADYQKMFAKIYPPQTRTLADAGVHLAEEVGEVSEAVHVFIGEHQSKQFEDICNEVSDYISCLFGVANSAKLDLALELSNLYSHNCHICHLAPCECSFSFVAKFKS